MPHQPPHIGPVVAVVAANTGLRLGRSTGNSGAGRPDRAIDGRDLEPMTMVLAQLRGRMLSVAAAKFADQLAMSLHRRNAAAA